MGILSYDYTDVNRMVLFWFLQVQFDVMKETLKLSPIFLMKKKIESYMFWVEIQNIESQ